MYHCVGNTRIRYSVRVLIGVSPGRCIVWEEKTTVGMAPEGLPVFSLGNSNDLRGIV